MIDILVLNYNDSETTSIFVNSVRDYSCVRKVLVVDNHSKDNSMEYLKALEDDKVLVVDSGENKGYGAGNNFGIRYLHEYFGSEFILLCNPDVVVDEHVCEKLESFLRSNDEYSIVAPFMLNAKGAKQNHTAFRIPSKWEYILSLDVFYNMFFSKFNLGNQVSNATDIVLSVGALAGSLFMMRAKDMLEYGMYDENIFLYCEELVLGIKMQNAKKKIALLPSLAFIHNHSVSISKTYKSLVSKQRLFMNSKLYVIRHYYHANVLERFVAFFLSKLSIIELELISLLRRLK